MEFIFKATWNFLIVIVGVYLYVETGQSAPIFRLNDKKVLEGTTIILPCEPAGFPAPNITWLFNDDPIPWKHSIDNDYLILNNVKHGRHDGRYTCVATSKAGTVFTSASLIVHVKPVITIKPTDQRKQEGSDVIFRLKTTGFPSPAIKWLFNDGPLAWNHSIDSFGSLIIKDVRRGKHDGRYTFVATNDVGSISTSATLFVYGACPSAWKTYRGSNSCYRIVNTRTAKWDDARRSCISMGGYLVTINSEEENRYVTKLASEASSAEIMWIGLSRISEDDFRWTDGTRLSGRYSKWNKGEPNNAKGNEDCVHLFVRDSHAPYWNDHICNYPDGKPFYACEMERI